MIESSRVLKFQWGVFDCALHVCNCLNAETGTDPGAAYRGKYSDEAGAAAIYGSSLEVFVAGICESLRMTEVHPNHARRGDVVFLDNDTDQGAIGVISLDARLVSCASDEGLALVPIGRWKRAWMVGR